MAQEQNPRFLTNVSVTSTAEGTAVLLRLEASDGNKGDSIQVECQLTGEQSQILGKELVIAAQKLSIAPD